MANYWDTFKPGLLAGEDYWEDFTPEAPTQTGVVGKVTGKRYQPWEKGYHKIAGLVDDSGEYDAWYDPDPPPETSRPDWGTPEGYENWKTRIGLETNNNNNNNNNQNPGDNTYIGPEGVEGSGRTDAEIEMREAQAKAAGNDQGFNFQDWVSNFSSSVNLGNLALAGLSGNPLMAILALSNTKIDSILDSVLNLTREGGGETEAQTDQADIDATAGGGHGVVG